MTVYAGQYGPEGMMFPNRIQAIDVPVAIKTLAGNIIPLYQDRGRVETLENPIRTDSYGNLTFFAEPGRYKMEIGTWNMTISVPKDPFEPEQGLSPEERIALAEDIEDSVEEGLSPPISLVLLFNNAKT